LACWIAFSFSRRSCGMRTVTRSDVSTMVVRQLPVFV
jgi:hypothetical protein